MYNIKYYLREYSSCCLGGYFGLSLMLLSCINWLCIFVTNLSSINKNGTPMIKGRINFDLSESLAKVEICLSICFYLKENNNKIKWNNNTNKTK